MLYRYRLSWSWSASTAEATAAEAARVAKAITELQRLQEKTGVVQSIRRAQRGKAIDFKSSADLLAPGRVSLVLVAATYLGGKLTAR